MVEEKQEELNGGASQQVEDDEWEPLIVAFLCNWCSYEGADKAGGSKLDVPSNVLPIRLMCSSRLDYQYVVRALTSGADGVMILGCHPGDCHYRKGNYHTLRRQKLFDKLMDGMEVDEERVYLDWVSAGEGQKFSEVTQEMAEKVEELGPFPR
ncbi:MAG: hydrogenase iron-sulfur subunit [Candidatus Nanohaloarchaea archaeon]